QVLCRAARDGLHRDPAVQEAEGPFEQPGRGGDRKGRLGEGGAAEEMVHQQHERLSTPERREQWDLVEVLDHGVEPEPAEVTAIVPRRRQTECIAAAHAVHIHPVHALPAGAAGPGRDEQGDAVAPSGEPAEDLVEVDLRAARARIQPVLPVHDEEVQARSPSRIRRPWRRCCRISASSTPLTNRGLSAVPYFSARTMASWMDTGGGT